MNNTQSSEKQRYRNLNTPWPKTWCMNNLQCRISKKNYLFSYFSTFSSWEAWVRMGFKNSSLRSKSNQGYASLAVTHGWANHSQGKLGEGGLLNDPMAGLELLDGCAINGLIGLFGFSAASQLDKRGKKTTTTNNNNKNQAILSLFFVTCKEAKNTHGVLYLSYLLGI